MYWHFTTKRYLTCGSIKGFMGGFGTSGKVIFQSYKGLLTLAHPSPIEHKSFVSMGVTLIIFNTDIFAKIILSFQY